MLAAVKDIKISDKGVTLVFNDVEITDEILTELRRRIGDFVDIQFDFTVDKFPDEQ